MSAGVVAASYCVEDNHNVTFCYINGHPEDVSELGTGFVFSYTTIAAASLISMSVMEQRTTS